MKKNKVKKHTFKDQIRNAWRAFRCKPAGSISIGVEVKHCLDCEYRKKCKEMEKEEKA